MSVVAETHTVVRCADRDSAEAWCRTLPVAAHHRATVLADFTEHGRCLKPLVRIRTHLNNCSGFGGGDASGGAAWCNEYEAGAQ